jgi:hypothetical protein
MLHQCSSSVMHTVTKAITNNYVCRSIFAYGLYSIGLHTVPISDRFTARSDGYFPVPSEVRMHTIGPVHRDPLRLSYRYLVDLYYFPIING